MPTIELGRKVPSTTMSPCQDQLFADLSLPENLSGHAVSSGFITASAQAAKFGLTLIGAVILGRLLTPQDFGLVGMVSATTAFLSLFSDAGLSTATVQREKLTEGQASNLFWVNLCLSTLMGFVAVVLAPAVAWFYHDARLVAITIALAFTFPLTGLATQHRALLNRQMRFRTLAIIDIGSMLVSMVVGCTMAFFHCGYWSLAGMQLAAAITTCILTWGNFRWSPRKPARATKTGPLVRFGLDLTASNLLYRTARTSDVLLLGKFWGAAPVGLYSRASVLLLRPMEQFLSPISSELLPTLSRLQNNPDRYRRAFLRAYDTIALVSFPLSALFLAIAQPLVLVLLGPQWEGSVKLFAGFTATALYMPLAVAATWLFTSQGRSRDLLLANLLLAFLTVAAFLGGLPFGAFGMVLSFSLSGLLVRLPLLYYIAGRNGLVKALDLWKVFFRHLPMWLSVYGVTMAAQTISRRSPPWEQLILCVPIGLAVGALAAFTLPHPRRCASSLLHAAKGSFSRWAVSIS
jgi:O-antigen/teichoic acid export membrane protein